MDESRPDSRRSPAARERGAARGALRPRGVAGGAFRPRGVAGGAFRPRGAARGSQRDARSNHRLALFGRFGRRGTAFLAVLLVVGALLTGVAGTALAGAAQGSGDDLLLTRLASVFKLVRAAYIQEIPAEELFQAAIQGISSRLDPYSVYFDPTELENFVNTIEGNYVGIGVHVEFVSGYTTVVAPFAGSPAERAGIRSGDRIKEIDGKDVTGKPPDIVAPLIRGQAGTKVKLTILRGETNTPLVVEVERAQIHLKTIETKNLTPEIGYLKINSFSSDTGSEVKVALDQFKRAGIRGLVLDLRGNPGGSLQSGVEVASYFVGPAPVVHLVERGSPRRTLSGDQPAFGLPTAVLVNRGSASASELVAGAIQDSGAGILIGQPTFGKGVAQSVIDLPGGAAFKLTTMKYLTPKGRHPEPGKGLVPDVVLPVKQVQRLAPVPAGRALKAGDSGLAVLAAQERLAAAGFDPGPVDGVFNPRTEAAVRRFQQAQGLAVTGAVDGETVERLNRDRGPANPRDTELDRALEFAQEKIRTGRWLQPDAAD